MPRTLPGDVAKESGPKTFRGPKERQSFSATRRTAPEDTGRAPGARVGENPRVRGLLLGFPLFLVIALWRSTLRIRLVGREHREAIERVRAGRSSTPSGTRGWWPGSSGSRSAAS